MLTVSGKEAGLGNETQVHVDSLEHTGTGGRFGKNGCARPSLVEYKHQQLPRR
jgi:hypothetical protein